MDRKTKLTLIVITFLGLALRVFKLPISPPSLNWDELALGYNSYSLLKTGKDEFGKPFPIFLRSFDDYKPSIYSYLSIPFIFLFGLNETSVRILSSLSGTLLIPLAFYYANHLTRNKNTALLSSFVLAISPWAILFSRAAFEANLALFFYLTGVLFLILPTRRTKETTLSILFLTLATYTYHSTKILAPLTFLLFFRSKPKTITIFFIFLIPLLYLHLTHPEVTSRITATSLFTALKINQELTLPKASAAIFARYLAYFSPTNLFVRGTPEPTQSLPDFGVFYHFWFFFWLAGLVSIFKQPKKYQKLVVLILIAPFPAIFTWNWFYPARVLPLFFLFSLVIALGLSNTHRDHRLYYFSLPLTIITFLHLLSILFFVSPETTKGNWQYGMKEIVTEIRKIENQYDHVVFETRTAQPHIFVLFYSQYPPRKYQQDIFELSQNPTNRKSFDFGKYEFRDVYWFRQDENLRNTLLVAPPASLPTEKITQSPYLNEVVIVKDNQGNTLAHLVGLK